MITQAKVLIFLFITLRKEIILVTITVVIPFRNSNKFIQETLESVLECRDYISDIVCINNASEDDSVQTLEKFFKKVNKDFKLINNKKNMGYARSIHKGLLSSLTRYALVLNSDDLINPKYLKAAKQLFNHSNTVGMVCPSIRQFGQFQGKEDLVSKFAYLENRQDKLLNLFGENPLPASGSIYDLSKFSKNWSNSKNDWASDWELALNYLLISDVIQIKDEWVKYRVHEESLTKTFDDLDKDIYYLFMFLRLITRIKIENLNFDESFLRKIQESHHWMHERFPLTYNFIPKLMDILTHGRGFGLEFDYNQEILNEKYNFHQLLANVVIKKIAKTSTSNHAFERLLSYINYRSAIDSNRIVRMNKS